MPIKITLNTTNDCCDPAAFFQVNLPEVQPTPKRRPAPPAPAPVALRLMGQGEIPALRKPWENHRKTIGK